VRLDNPLVGGSKHPLARTQSVLLSYGDP